MASLAVLLAFVLPLAVSQFVPPEIILQAGYPAGFRAFIPDFPGCQRFAFHGKINNPFIHNNELGSIYQEVQRPQNGFWVIQDYKLILTAGDIIHYRTNVVKDGVAYPKYNQTWKVPDPENAVDILSPIKPQESNPEKTMETKPAPTEVTPGIDTSPTSGEPSLSSSETTTVSSGTKATKPSPPSSVESSPSAPSTTTSNSEPKTTKPSPTSTESSPPSSVESTPSAPSTPTPNSEPTTIKPSPTSTESSPPSSVESSSVPSTTTPIAEPTTTTSVETSPSASSTTISTSSATTQTSPSTTKPTETTVSTTTATTLTTPEKKPPSEKRETPKPDAEYKTPSDKTDDLSTPIPPERPISGEFPENPPQYPFSGLFPKPFKPMMPSNGPGFEICSNPWIFEERIDDSRTQKLERQVAKLQCQLALFQRGYNQLSDTVESELTDLKKLIYGMVSRMANLESLLRSSPFG